MAVTQTGRVAARIITAQCSRRRGRWSCHSISIRAEGRLVNLGCGTGHPGFVMSASFTNQTIAQIEFFNNAEKYSKTVTVLLKNLDEKVALLHLDKFGVKLTTLSEDQGELHRRRRQGCFKGDAYRDQAEAAVRGALRRRSLGALKRRDFRLSRGRC